MKDFANFIAEDKDPNEYDNEGEMAKSQLRTVMSAAEDLMNLLDDEDNLPEWAQGKITKAVDYLDSVRDYMTSEAQDDLEEKVQPKEFSKLRGSYKDTRSGAVIEFDSQGFVVELKNGKIVTFEWNNMVAESVNLDEQFEEAFDYFLTDEDIDEAIVESIRIPTDIAKRIPGVKGMLYKKALRYYLDWRKKNPGQGAQGLVKVAKILRVDTHTLQNLLHSLIAKGKLPKHLAVTDMDNQPDHKGGYATRGGFLQR